MHVMGVGVGYLLGIMTKLMGKLGLRGLLNGCSIAWPPFIHTLIINAFCTPFYQQGMLW